MMSNGLDRLTMKCLRVIFADFPALQKAVLFGSRAKGTQTRGSDIDIAVEGLSDAQVVKLSMQLNQETTLPFFFDVVAIESISSEELLEHIRRMGQVVYKIKTAKKEVNCK